MSGVAATMMDLADYLGAEVAKVRSLRKVADHIGISKTTLQKIVKRKLKRKPEVETLEKIADAYDDLTLPTVVEMAGSVLGDTERAQHVARELEKAPWIRERLDTLLSMSQSEFEEVMRYLAFRRQGGRPPDRNDGQSSA